MLDSFRDGWVDIGGVSSHVLTWGGWLDDPLPPGGTILLFMCGVPGLTFFYRTFLEELYNRLKIPVWTICVAGQELPPPESGLKLPKDKSLYNNVKAQVKHKVEFVNKYVPRDQKVILVGHSFGGKMVLELLKDEDLLSQTRKCFLLMPTLERFSDLPRARYWLTLTRTGLVYFLLLISIILSLVASWRRTFCEWYFKSRGFKSVDKYCMKAMNEFAGHPTLLSNVGSLAYDELTAIKDLDVDVLNKISDRTKVFFALNDYWAPLTHYNSLKKAVPQLSVEILESKFQHAFTIDSSHRMAEIIASDFEVK